jgi:hypothetical protein
MVYKYLRKPARGVKKKCYRESNSGSCFWNFEVCGLEVQYFVCNAEQTCEKRGPFHFDTPLDTQQKFP